MGRSMRSSIAFPAREIISLTFSEQAARDFSGFGEVVEQTPLSVQLKVPRAKVTEICRQLLEACQVTDINVQEMPVEEVIRQLFGEQRRAKRERTRAPSCRRSSGGSASFNSCT